MFEAPPSGLCPFQGLCVQPPAPKALPTAAGPEPLRLNSGITSSGKLPTPPSLLQARFERSSGLPQPLRLPSVTAPNMLPSRCQLQPIPHPHRPQPPDQAPGEQSLAPSGLSSQCSGSGPRAAQASLAVLGKWADRWVNHNADQSPDPSPFSQLKASPGRHQSKADSGDVSGYCQFVLNP